jgi:hypothetical protein
MYETYPKKQNKGSESLKSGTGSKTSYPSKSLPNSRDDHNKVNLKSQTGTTGSKPAATYPKGRAGKDSFPSLNGLPK